MLKKILFALIILMIGIGIGKFYLNDEEGTVMPSPNSLYHATSVDGVALRAKSEFSGTIHEVKEGDLIMDAVRKASPGDLIRVYPGTYKETVISTRMISVFRVSSRRENGLFLMEAKSSMMHFYIQAMVSKLKTSKLSTIRVTVSWARPVTILCSEITGSSMPEFTGFSLNSEKMASSNTTF